MTLPELLHTLITWLAWAGLGMAVITLVAFLAGWGFRFRLIGVTSFTFLLAISFWTFGLSYQPNVAIEGAKTLQIVFDNSNDLVVAQAPADLDPDAIEPSLQQLVDNLRSSGRSSPKVQVRIRRLVPVEDGLSEPVILAEGSRDFRQQLPPDRNAG
ncbi:MAG: DUF2518 family protein [Prochlorococcus sp.]